MGAHFTCDPSPVVPACPGVRCSTQQRCTTWCPRLAAAVKSCAPALLRAVATACPCATPRKRQCCNKDGRRSTRTCTPLCKTALSRDVALACSRAFATQWHCAAHLYINAQLHAPGHCTGLCQCTTCCTSGGAPSARACASAAAWHTCACLAKPLSARLFSYAKSSDLMTLLRMRSQQSRRIQPHLHCSFVGRFAMSNAWGSSTTVRVYSRSCSSVLHNKGWPQPGAQWANLIQCSNKMF